MSDERRSRPSRPLSATVTSLRYAAAGSAAIAAGLGGDLLVAGYRGFELGIGLVFAAGELVVAAVLLRGAVALRTGRTAPPWLARAALLVLGPVVVPLQLGHVCAAALFLTTPSALRGSGVQAVLQLGWLAGAIAAATALLAAMVLALTPAMRRHIEEAELAGPAGQDPFVGGVRFGWRPSPVRRARRALLLAVASAALGVAAWARTLYWLTDGDLAANASPVLTVLALLGLAIMAAVTGLAASGVAHTGARRAAMVAATLAVVVQAGAAAVAAIVLAILLADPEGLRPVPAVAAALVANAVAAATLTAAVISLAAPAARRWTAGRRPDPAVLAADGTATEPVTADEVTVDVAAAV
jgi:hypothetical protein